MSTRTTLQTAAAVPRGNSSLCRVRRVCLLAPQCFFYKPDYRTAPQVHNKSPPLYLSRLFQCCLPHGHRNQSTDRCARSLSSLPDRQTDRHFHFPVTQASPTSVQARRQQGVSSSTQQLTPSPAAEPAYRASPEPSLTHSLSVLALARSRKHETASTGLDDCVGGAIDSTV